MLADLGHMAVHAMQRHVSRDHRPARAQQAAVVQPEDFACNGPRSALERAIARVQPFHTQAQAETWHSAHSEPSEHGSKDRRTAETCRDDEAPAPPRLPPRSRNHQRFAGRIGSGRERLETV